MNFNIRQCTSGTPIPTVTNTVTQPMQGSTSTSVSCDGFSSSLSLVRMCDQELKGRVFANGMTYYEFAQQNNGVFFRDAQGRSVYSGIDSKGEYVKKVKVSNTGNASDWQTLDNVYGKNASAMNDLIKRVEMGKFIADRGLVKSEDGAWHRTNKKDRGAYTFDLSGENFVAKFSGGEINGKKYPPMKYTQGKWSDDENAGENLNRKIDGAIQNTRDGDAATLKAAKSHTDTQVGNLAKAADAKFGAVAGVLKNTGEALDAHGKALKGLTDEVDKHGTKLAAYDKALENAQANDQALLKGINDEEKARKKADKAEAKARKAADRAEARAREAADKRHDKKLAELEKENEKLRAENQRLTNDLSYLKDAVFLEQNLAEKEEKRGLKESVEKLNHLADTDLEKPQSNTEPSNTNGNKVDPNKVDPNIDTPQNVDNSQVKRRKSEEESPATVDQTEPNLKRTNPPDIKPEVNPVEVPLGQGFGVDDFRKLQREGIAPNEPEEKKVIPNDGDAKAVLDILGKATKSTVEDIVGVYKPLAEYFGSKALKEINNLLNPTEPPEKKDQPK